MIDFMNDLKGKVEKVNPTLELIKEPGEINTPEKISEYKKALQQLAGVLDYDSSLKSASSKLEKCSDERIAAAKELVAIEKKMQEEPDAKTEAFSNLDKEYTSKFQAGNFSGTREVDNLADNGEELKANAIRLVEETKQRFKEQAEKMGLETSEDGMSTKNESYNKLAGKDPTVYLDEILDYLDENRKISEGQINKLESISNALKGETKDKDKSIESNEKDSI